MAETSVAPEREPTEDEAAKVAAAEAAFDTAANWMREFRRDMVRSAWFWRGAIIGLVAGLSGGGIFGVLWQVGADRHYDRESGWAWWVALLPVVMAVILTWAAYSVLAGVAWARENRAALKTAFKHLPRGVRTIFRETYWVRPVPGSPFARLVARLSFHRSRADGLNIPRPPVDVRGSLRRGWRLAGTFTDLVAGAGGIFIGGAVLLEGTPPTSEVGIFALVFLALGLWFAVKGIKKIRAWWLRLD